jgi:hypothetical protein
MHQHTQLCCFFIIFFPLILQYFDWLAAFHLELLQAILFIVVELSALVFLATCFQYCSRSLPTTFFPDIAPSRILEVAIFNSVDSGHMDYSMHISHKCTCLSCVPGCVYKSQDIHMHREYYSKNNTNFANFCYQKQLKKHVKLQ